MEGEKLAQRGSDLHSLSKIQVVFMKIMTDRSYIVGFNTSLSSLCSCFLVRGDCGVSESIFPINK
jgi:hypothetical protein